MKFFWGRKKKPAVSVDADPVEVSAAAAQDAPEDTLEAAPEHASARASGPLVSADHALQDAPAPPASALIEEPAASPAPAAPISGGHDDESDPGGDAEPETPAKRGLFARLSEGLKRSSSKLGADVSALFTKRKLDRAALDDLEDLLLAADLGAGPASRVIERLAKDRFDKTISELEIKEALAAVVAETLAPHERDLDLSGTGPQVIMFVGVNGSGKTTTVGKIGALVAREGRSAVMAAGDTFRAAAIEQLQVWGERAGLPVVARSTGADAAGLVFDAYEQARSADILLVDTAGRLQNKSVLMDELKKIVRVLKKQDAAAPHHVLLVLDATVGQNALSQVDAFKEAAGVTGLIMTKLDGTAKGGVLVAIADKHPDLPIYFTGVGEGIDDLAPFDAAQFARALAGLSGA